MKLSTLTIGMFVASAILILILFSMVCCNSFKPVWVDELPRECNMSLNVIKLYYDSKDKSGAVPGIEECYQCLKRTRCQENVYGRTEKGLNPVDYSDVVKKNYYLQCLSEK